MGMKKRKNPVILLVGPNASGKTTILEAMRSDCRKDLAVFDEPFACMDEKAVRGIAEDIAKKAAKRKVVVATVRDDAASLFPEGTNVHTIRLRGGCLRRAIRSCVMS
jgi:ABC-type Mn2+/Zn2+ transport system ATPase subunit